MEIKEIIESLKYNKEGKFQKESILEARKKQKEVTEELLKELNKIEDNIEYYVQDKNYILHLYAMYLLAEFKEKRAFSIIIKIITNKRQEDINFLLGDLITEDLKSILASTFDGNLDSLYNVITNLELNEYVRCAAFNSLGILQKYNIVKQEQIMDMIEKMLQNELNEDFSIVISDIIVYIAENRIYDKVELVKKLYKQNRVDIQMIGGYDDIIDEIYGGKQYYSDKSMIEDTIKSMSCWACFDNENKKDFDFKKSIKDLMRYENKQVQNEINQVNKIGRNDLCYCRKWKKI